MPSPDQQQRTFDRLVEALLEGRALFFLGSGISRDSKIPGDNDFKPTIKWMQRQLKKRACELLTDGTIEKTHGIAELLRSSVRFDRCVELVSWVLGHHRICEILQIANFDYLEPLPAHRYLAWMAREGLIQEIITTNWDSCIEQAYLESLGLPGHSNSQRLRVIYNLDTYRTNAGHWRTPDFQSALWLHAGHWRTPDFQSALRLHAGHWCTPVFRSALRLYKINGCARAYNRGQSPPEEILLTERQLQRADDDGRRWVRDLLADRMRRHAFCFVGFGSDETQVRHTLLSVIEEFGRQGQTAQQFVWELPNAPFITAHSTRSFVQLQLARAFVEAHGGANGEKGLQLLEENTLDGDFGFHLKRERQLPADELLGELFRVTYRCLIRHHLRVQGPFYQWLADCTEEPIPWVAPFLDPTSEDIPCFKDSLLKVEPGETLSPFFLWLCTAWNPHERGQSYYCALVEAPVFVSTMLVLLGAKWQVDTSEENGKPWHEDIEQAPGLGLKIDWHSFFPSAYLVAGHAPEPANDTAPAGQRLISRVLVPMANSSYQQRYMIHRNSKTGDLFTWRWVAADAAAWIKVAKVPQKLDSALPRLMAKARAKPTAIRQRLICVE